MMILPNDLHIDMALDVSYLVLSKIAQDFDVNKIEHIVILFGECNKQIHGSVEEIGRVG